MLKIGQLWQHKNTNQQVRIKNIDNKIIVAESVIDGRMMFLIETQVIAEYRVVQANPQINLSSSNPGVMVAKHL